MKVEVTQLSFEGAVETRFQTLYTAISKDVIKENIEKGFLKLYGVFADSFLIGCFISRIDLNFDGTQDLVIMHVFTMYDRADLNFLSTLNVIFDKLADGRDIRIHSQRRGADIYLEKNGYEFMETVFIKRGK